MAAAARLNEPDPALSEISNRLSALRSKCRTPSGLEEEIEQIRSVDMTELASAVEDYASALPSAVGQAARLQLEDLEYAVDAFYDYVRHREDHEDHEHVIGRAEVARYLRDTLEKTMAHFRRGEITVARTGTDLRSPVRMRTGSLPRRSDSSLEPEAIICRSIS